MPGILDLPDELLCSVLRLLRGSCTLNQAWQVLTTCRKLYGLGKVILTEHIKLTDCTAMPFIWTSIAAPNAFSHAKSLTVELHLDWPHLIDRATGDGISSVYDELRHWDYDRYQQGPCSQVCREPFDSIHHQPMANQTEVVLKAVSKTLSTTMRKLLSFSLIIHAEPLGKAWCRCLQPFFSTNLIAKIIEALPTTCTTLYIDIGGALVEDAEETLVQALLQKRWLIENLHVRMRFGIAKLFLLDTDLLQHWKSHESRAFSAHVPDSELEYGEWMPDDLWELSDSTFLSYQAWKRTVDHNITADGVHTNDEADNKGQSSNGSIIVWPRLRSLTLGDSAFPLPILWSQADDLSPFARIIGQNINRFPALQKAIIIQTRLDQISEDELSLLSGDCSGTRKHPDPHWYPISSFVVWDIINRETHLLPIQPCIPEAEFPRMSIASTPYYILHDPYNNFHHSSHRGLIRIVDESFGLSWMSSAADRALLPLQMARDLGFQPTTGINGCDVIENLAERNYDMSLYLRALASRAYMEPGLNDRLEIYWNREVTGKGRKIITRSLLKDIATVYKGESSDRNLLIHPWVWQWLEDGEDIERAEGSYKLV